MSLAALHPGAVDLGEVAAFNAALEAYKRTSVLRFDRRTAEAASRMWAEIPSDGRAVVAGGVLLGLGTLAVAVETVGLHFPDLDIRLMGIGTHRYWLLHSAAAGWAVHQLVQAAAAADVPGPVVRAAAAAGAGGCFGLGIHLVKDGAFGLFDGEKSVTFGIPGVALTHTLVRGTYIDDDLWLLGNAVWAFRLSYDLAVIAGGKDLETVVAWVRHTFEPYVESVTSEPGRKTP